MNVLVFGGTRFMGTHLVKELISKGHQVTIATRGILPDGFGRQVTRIVVDRTDGEILQRNIPKVLYDVVFDDIAYCSNDVKILLDTVRCKRYVQVSTMSVYPKLHNDIREEEYDPKANELIYCSRNDDTYDKVKQQAESAIVQVYSHIPSAMVRFPFVIGTDDYTKRLYFYVDHIVNQKPMSVDNMDAKMAFVRSDEAGKFLAFLGESDFIGPINGASEQTVSLREIAGYIKEKTGKSPILSEDGEKAPYNGAEDYSMNVEKARSLGYSFTPLTEWIYGLIDSFITEAEQ